MFERLAEEARATTLAACGLAAERGADKAGPDHLLLALAADTGGDGARILAGFGVTAAALEAAADRASRRAGLSEEEIAALREVGIDAEEIFRRIESSFGPEALSEAAGRRPAAHRGRMGGPFDRVAGKVLELSLREAVSMGHRRISTAHILLGLLRQGVSGPLAAVLAERGVTYGEVRRLVRTELGGAA